MSPPIQGRVHLKFVVNYVSVIFKLHCVYKAASNLAKMQVQIQ